MDLIEFLREQRDFSADTFGPGRRTGTILDHIKKEMVEVEADPTDLEEWIDIVLLAFDGAWRCAGPASTPEQVVRALRAKLRRNQLRTWPDWRAVPDGQAIEHIRK